MRLLVVEFLCSGQWHCDPQDSMFREGRAMLQAVVADLATCSGVELSVLLDPTLPVTVPDNCRVVRLPEGASLADFLARDPGFDRVLLIAPELEGCLMSLASAAGDRLLGGSLAAIELASDKQRLAEHLAAYDVPTPRGQIVAADQAFPPDAEYPAVLKPIDGAGSQGLAFVASPQHLIQRQGPLRLEKWCPGRAASCAILAGPSGLHPLTPCWQHLTDDGHWLYLGGSTIEEQELQLRAQSLALRGMQTLPNPVGYWGVDLVLGESPSEDYLIEINPRLTTSYVGLRAACSENLGRLMLEVAQSATYTLSCEWHSVAFTADGTLSRISRNGAAPQ